MFPGFDEPGFKTPFDIAVTTRAGNAVIGNAPVRAEQPAGEGLKRVEFDDHAAAAHLPDRARRRAARRRGLATPLPPNNVRSWPLPLRGVATRGKGPKLRYALENTNAIVTYLEEYFGVAVPVPEARSHRLAGLRLGGMENAGRHCLRRPAPAASPTTPPSSSAAASAGSTPTSWPTSGSATW